MNHLHCNNFSFVFISAKKYKVDSDDSGSSEAELHSLGSDSEK